MEDYFSLNIEYLRKSKGWTQSQLADNVDITNNAVSAWENKRSYPNAITLLRISNLFRVSLDDLLKKDLARVGDNPTPNQASLKNDKSLDSYTILLEDAIRQDCPKLAKRLNL